MEKRFKCTCGLKFSVSEKPVNGRVFCPGCGRQKKIPAGVFDDDSEQMLSNEFENSPETLHSFPAGATMPPAKPHGMAYAGAQPYGHNRPSENTYSVIGFILSLVSFFSCFLLAPIALFVNFKGLKERDGKGYAIAGLLISGFQTFGLVCFVAYFTFLVIVLGGIGAAAMSFFASEADTLVKYGETKKVISEARNEIQQFQSKNKRWPNEVEAKSILSKHLDAWKRPLKLKKEPGDRNRLVSAGKDGRFDTRDDVDELRVGSLALNLEKEIRKSTDRIARNIDVNIELKDVDSALKKLDNRRYFEKQRAINWLKTAKIDSKDRAKVIEKIRPLLFDRDCSSAAMQIYKKLEPKSDLPKLVELIDATATNNRRFWDWKGVFDLFADYKLPERVLVFINHPNSSVRDAANRWVKRRKITSTKIIEHCLKDLSDSKRKLFALEALAKLEKEKDLHSKVLQGIAASLQSNDRRENVKAIAVVKKWGGDKSILDELIRLKVTDQIVTIKDRRTLQYLGKRLEQWPIHSSEAAKHLKKIGPAAEEYVWPVLNNRSFIVAKEGVRLLAEIGTERSIQKLKAIKNKSVIRLEVERAIESIERANRTPESWD